MTSHDRLTLVMRKHGLGSLLTALSSAIVEEAAALSPLNPRGALERSRKFYADEITEACAEAKAGTLKPLTADQILGHRRIPTVWAIATLLHEHGAVDEVLSGGEP